MGKRIIRFRILLHHARLTLVLLLGACTVGPDFKPPRPPDVASLPIQLPGDRVVADGKSQRLIRDYSLPQQWWKLFRSQQLTDLVELALRNNHDLKATQAALRIARANYEAQKGALFPVVGVGETSSRQKAATADLSAPTISGDPYFTLHTVQLTVSYVPDVFGGIRRQVEAASAQEEAQGFALKATHLTLTSNIALAAIQEASLNEQIKETSEAIGRQRMLAHGEQYAKGNFDSASARDWAALRTAIAQAEQTIPLLKKQLAVQHDLLTALSAQYPGAARPTFTSLGALQLPGTLPYTLPAQIVAQRPDVRAAEANLHAATALVGVAIANRIPLFNIAGSIGRTSGQPGNLVSPAPPFLFWTLAGNVTQTIFDGFTLEQRQRAAEAGWNLAAEQYQSTVVNALQNVADALEAIGLDSESVQKAQDATKAARENLCLTVAGFAGYSGKTEPGDVGDLDQINDKKGQKADIAKDFGKWWKNVCGRDLKFEARLRRLLREEEPSNTAGSTTPPPAAPSGIDVVSSEQLYLATRLSLVTARATRLMDTVALFQALGGGWWNQGGSGEPEEGRRPIADAELLDTSAR